MIVIRQPAQPAQIRQTINKINPSQRAGFLTQPAQKSK